MLPRLLILAALGAALLFLVLAFSTGWRNLRMQAAPSDPARVIADRGDLTGFESGAIDVFARSVPGVLHVSTSTESVQWFESLGRERGWVEGEASGFLWDDRGHVVTNQHVIEGAQTLVVSDADGARYSAELVGVSEDFDLALLHVKGLAGRLEPLPIGSSADLVVGQVVFAIGSPLGLDHTLSGGLIGGLGRAVRDDRGRLLTGLIQTGAGIHPGNSGGPLLDTAGRVIGVATAVARSPLGTGGIGFAIPIDVVNRVVPRLISRVGMGQASIGLLVAHLGVRDSLGVEGGLPIGLVLPDSPAERAGLRGVDVRSDGDVTADVLLTIGGVELANSGDLVMAMADFAPGDVVTAEIWRDGQVFEVELETVELESIGAR